jgi:hypothetical protein
MMRLHASYAACMVGCMCCGYISSEGNCSRKACRSHTSECLLYIARRYYSYGPTPTRNILATDGLMIWVLEHSARECIQINNITTTWQNVFGEFIATPNDIATSFKAEKLPFFISDTHLFLKCTAPDGRMPS